MKLKITIKIINLSDLFFGEKINKYINNHL